MKKLRRNRHAPTQVSTHSSSSNAVVSGSHPLLPAASNDAVKGASVPTSHSTFDALELLGPSLSEVLTFVNPPQSRRLQETQHDDAGKATTGGETIVVDNQLDQSSSTSSLVKAKSPAKFGPLLSRSAILGKLVDLSLDNTRKTQEYFTTMLSTIECEATGLVLLHDATVVIFLETTAEQFVLVLKQLLLQQIIDAGSMKVLANCDAHGVRILQGLYFKKIVINRSSTGEWTDDASQQSIVDTFLNLIKFIRKIGPMLPGEVRKCLTTLSNSDQSFLPSNDLVLWLLCREELMTLPEYLAVFDSPVVVELESERVWPVHPLINY